MSDTPPASPFRRPMTLAALAARHHDTAVERLGIEFLQIGPDVLRARMPVDGRTKQPAGILHGGASVVLAETLGSAAANLCLPEGQQAVARIGVSSCTSTWAKQACIKQHHYLP